MTYTEDAGAQSARLISTSEQLSQPGIGRAVALGSQTDGSYGLFRGVMAEGSDIAAHFHRTFSESFYILSGRVDFWDGGAWREASSDELIYIPAGGIHGLRVTEGPADVLTLFLPGIPREQFVLELLEIRRAGRELTTEEWTELYARHDQYMV